MPDPLLDVDVSSLGARHRDVLRKTKAVLEEEQPDAFPVLDDTTARYR